MSSLESKLSTNIVRLTTAIRREDENAVQQVLFYDSGIGTQGPIDKLIGGCLGEGINVNIQALYTFLALNYDDGDEVYLFGFSRGSYTVRSLAGMIYESGLVRRDHIKYVREAYELYRDNEDVESDLAKAFRAAHGDRIPITLLACFDTVGSLGLPFKGPGFIRGFNMRRYEFHTITLNNMIRNAIHILSIDEDRSIFTPTLMECHPDLGEEQLTEKYLWGKHGGVGGGDAVQKVSSIVALRFLIEEMQRRGLGLAFDMSKVPEYEDATSVLENENGEELIVQIVGKLLGTYVRPISSIDMVHPLAIKRYQTLPTWRPKALESLDKELMSAEVEDVPSSSRSYIPEVTSKEENVENDVETDTENKCD